MPLVTSEKMLADAQKGGYAVGAFNVENMEMVKAVIAAAEELHAPVRIYSYYFLKLCFLSILNCSEIFFPAPCSPIYLIRYFPIFQKQDTVTIACRK